MCKSLCEALGIKWRPEMDTPFDFTIPKDAKSDKHGFRNPHYGLKHSEESRRLISETKRGINVNTSLELEKKRKRWLLDNPNNNPIAKAKAIDAIVKVYLVVSPLGETIKVKNMAKFCRENNLHKGNMCSVAKGKLKHYKNWKCSYINN